MSTHAFEGSDPVTFDNIEVGRERAVVHTISASDIDTFGHLSGDLNPLHMDESCAAHSPFHKRVAHGMFTAAIVSAAHTALTGAGFVYVGQALRFLAPVYIGDTVTASVRVVEKKLAKRVLVMETTVKNQHGEVVLTGTSALKELWIASKAPV